MTCPLISLNFIRIKASLVSQPNLQQPATGKGSEITFHLFTSVAFLLCPSSLLLLETRFLISSGWIEERLGREVNSQEVAYLIDSDMNLCLCLTYI